jgi:DNA-binding Lrp family transcriptional regulator
MKMKNLDLKILSELIKDSKTSDRTLAKKIGVSQPTVTRRRARLETTGVIKEYTFVPDFPKLGYHIMAITLFKYGTDVDAKDMAAAREKAKQIVKESPFEMVMAERGIGIDYDGVTISFHRNYGDFAAFREHIRHLLPTKAYKVDSFLVNLDDDVHYRPLTFSTLATHLLKPPAE